MASLPTQRSLAELKKLGFLAQVVERTIPYARKKLDLFGGIDIVAVQPGIGVMGVQACRGGDHATRRKKLIAEPKLRTWLESGARLEVWSWAKRGERGKRKLWTLRREEIELADMPTV